MMMIVSPVYGERNTLFGIFMIILFTAVLITNLPQANKNYLKHIESGFYSLLVIAGTLNIWNVYKNYELTNQIQNKNINLVEKYKESNSGKTLELYKLVDDRYGWSMPDYSKYHENWFKIYYNIPEVEIIWIDYTNM